MSTGSQQGWVERLAVDGSGRPVIVDRDRVSAHATPSRGKVLGGAALLVLGLLLLGYLAFSLVRDGSLWIAGERVAATVVDLWAVPQSDPDAPEATFQYYMQYRFITPDGRAITRTTRVSAAEWGGLGTLGHGRPAYDAFDDAEVQAAAPVYQEQRHIPIEGIGGLETGGQVAVVYLPLYPQHNRLDESRFIPVLACAYLPLLGLGVGIVVVGWRLARGAPPATW